MANETLVAQLPGIIKQIDAEVLFKLQHLAGIMQCVRVIDTTGIPGNVVGFPIYGTVASSDVTQLTEGTDHSTNKQITNTATTATIAEHGIMAQVSDLAEIATYRDIVNDISTFFINGLMAKLEDDIVNLFADFASGNDVAGAGTSMTLDHWFQAKQLIKAGLGNVNNLCAVISPKQMWGPKGVSAILSSDSDQYGGTLSDEMKEAGFISKLAGIPVFVSNEINEDVGSGGDAAGCIMTRDAIGLHWKGTTVEMERDASLRGYQLVAVGRWGEVELVDAWGAYMLTDVA